MLSERISDGTVIVPDEPVDLPVNEPLEFEFRISEPRPSADEIKRREAAWERLKARKVRGSDIPLEALRREKMDEPPRGL